MKAVAVPGLVTTGLLFSAVTASAHNGTAETPAHLLYDFASSTAWVTILLVAILSVFWVRSLLRGRRR